MLRSNCGASSITASRMPFELKTLISAALISPVTADMDHKAASAAVKTSLRMGGDSDVPMMGKQLLKPTIAACLPSDDPTVTPITWETQHPGTSPHFSRQCQKCGLDAYASRWHEAALKWLPIGQQDDKERWFVGEFGIGQAVPRFEDPRLVRGEGR